MRGGYELYAFRFRSNKGDSQTNAKHTMCTLHTNASHTIPYARLIRAKDSSHTQPATATTRLPSPTPHPLASFKIPKSSQAQGVLHGLPRDFRPKIVSARRTQRSWYVYKKVHVYFVKQNQNTLPRHENGCCYTYHRTLLSRQALDRLYYSCESNKQLA